MAMQRKAVKLSSGRGATQGIGLFEGAVASMIEAGMKAQQNEPSAGPAARISATLGMDEARAHQDIVDTNQQVEDIVTDMIGKRLACEMPVAHADRPSGADQ